MTRLKDVVARGIYYSDIGINDYIEWSDKMVADFGEEIRPHMKDLRKWSIIIHESAAGNGDAEKLNCWNFMGCGLRMNGITPNPGDAGLCPVFIDKESDGMHSGRKAGRVCWTVLNTICNGSVQRTYRQKYETCSNCDFYRYVLDDEAANFLRAYLLRPH